MMVIFICLHITLPHYHHYADISEGIKLVNGIKVHPVEYMSKIKSILTIIFHAIYGTVCIQLTHFLCDDCENSVLYLIIIIKSEESPICHCSELDCETMVCAVCLSTFVNVITQPCHILKGSWAKESLKLWHEWVIIYHICMLWPIIKHIKFWHQVL